MKVVVCLAAARHPVSGKGAPSRNELQAIRLGRMLCGDPIGLHAGPTVDGIADALGHGLATILHAPIDTAVDAVPALASVLAELRPDLVLTGKQGQGGEDTGLLPYLLAKALGWPVVGDVVSIEAKGDGVLAVEQALGRGARRRLVVRAPAVIAVSPSAPAPLPFAAGAARRGAIQRLDVVIEEKVATGAQAFEERPYRKRPKMMAKVAAGASAADRLKAATQAAGGGGKLLVDPDPREAAEEILSYLEGLGLGPKAG
ncbi:Electron transfer flavoprotein, beta subunit [Hartmannibacter diazotrophicus]|uniref:Electron transfer flavoprotein, beta subunit n=1 Tax=Hartmannibacter diazotrophicus TaxID=1482074 RepID=A0A2C9D0B5_9HYPH|nr:electron transfer flavoprotein subunit beta [Hartmannibacter diazotrophicus]SON53608.1 Electron transfer flavoprotein, beta subunit [Hartmannibacter diazotrophicus]